MSDADLNDTQLLRYSRHILLPEIGVEGQERLCSARALVIGAGGLGSPIALYLAAAGVGTLTICDNDNVDVDGRDLGSTSADIKKISNYQPKLHIYLSLYWTITGLHAMHLIGGILVFAYLWGPGSKMWHTDRERFTNRIEISGLYWHFVDLVWVFVFPVLYLF